MNFLCAIKQLKLNLNGTLTVITKCPYYMKTLHSKCGAFDAPTRLV